MDDVDDNDDDNDVVVGRETFSCTLPFSYCYKFNNSYRVISRICPSCVFYNTVANYKVGAEMVG